MTPGIILKREIARQSMLQCMKLTWQKPNEPLIVGQHTRRICAEIDDCFEKFRKGISTYKIITVPYRHGKSDICSRYLPPKFLGEFPNFEVIMATYGANLSYKMSKDARNIMKSKEYQKLFDSRLDPKNSGVSEWGIENKMGLFTPIGIEGGIAGKGAHMLIIDDPLKGRKAAESKLIRENVWEAFRNDLFTRIAPVHIVLILATRWHKDDLIGRIIKEMEDPENEEFPQFEVIKIPARDESYETGYLFPERFTKKYYERAFAILGKYNAQALLQCEPTIKGGNLFDMTKIKIEKQFPKDLRFVRFWDLASTEKERVSEDPDFTAGSKIAVKEIEGLKHLYIADSKWCQEEAPKRNKMIVNTAKADGMGVWQGVESVAGYKDTYTTLKSVLKGVAIVKKCKVSGDKLVRAGDVEPIFEAGNVHLLKGSWNDKWIEQHTEFPSSDHDDIVDTTSGGYKLALKRVGGGKLGMAEAK